MDHQNESGVAQHHKRDEGLQLEQNKLILKNTKITIVVGVIAIVAQLLEVVVTLLK